jgi:HEPN domain-containing protein
LSQRSRRLLEEAIRDLEISCYNKAASASYFAVRMLAEEILKQLGEHIPRRDDKLANAIKNKGLRWEATAMVILYAFRKKADYEAGVTREEAELAVKLSMEVHKLLERYLEEIRGRRG